MKFYVVFICLQFALFANSITISRNVNDALNNMQQGNLQHAVNLIKKAAATNDIAAQFYMAQCYEYGLCISKDLEQAFRMYRRAAERGFPPAMKELSRLYANGIGVYQSSERATYWEKRYSQKAGNSQIPDLVSIYNRGLKNSDNLALNDHEKSLLVGNSGPQVVQESAKTVYIPSPIVLSKESLTEKKTEIKSDIDVDIPLIGKVNENTFAFIFANEDYQDVAKVPNAINDGNSIATYCNKTLGLPETNIYLIKNATLNNIRRELNRMKKIAEAYKNDASFIIYYAGHGVPDENTKNAYLLPVDGFVDDPTTCFSLTEFYNEIGKLPVKRNIIFLDACFSGSTRNNDMLASARGVVITPKPAKPIGNTLVITSSQGNETSYSYDEKQHGLFTYFLLKKIKESRGELNMGALFDYVKENVSKKSIVVNGKSQTPTVSLTQSIAEDWKQWEFN